LWKGNSGASGQLLAAANYKEHQTCWSEANIPALGTSAYTSRCYEDDKVLSTNILLMKYEIAELDFEMVS